MRALITQFDDHRLTSAVATPTCSSCCCCCCCLATSIAASSLLAQRVGKEGEKHQVVNRHLLTVLAALFVPIVGVLVYFGAWTINTIFRTCTERSYGTAIGGTRDVYTVCTNPASAAILPLLIIAPMLVLWYLYMRVQIKNPLKRAIMVTFLIALAFIIEFIAGAGMILTGVGGIAYLCLVPVVVGWISVWYHRHIGKEVVELPVSAPQPVNPVNNSESVENHVEQNEQPKPSEELPKQDPPAPVV